MMPVVETLTITAVVIGTVWVAGYISEYYVANSSTMDIDPAQMQRELKILLRDRNFICTNRDGLVLVTFITSNLTCVFEVDSGSGKFTSIYNLEPIHTVLDGAKLSDIIDACSAFMTFYNESCDRPQHAHVRLT